MSTDAQADAGYPSKTSLSPKPWHMSSLKASWVAGHARSALTEHGACVCMWTWWQIAPLRVEHVWNGSGTGSGTVTRVACTLEC